MNASMLVISLLRLIVFQQTVNVCLCNVQLQQVVNVQFVFIEYNMHITYSQHTKCT